MTSLWNWLTTLISGQPHFTIGGQENPYLLRWFLIPRNRWMNVYLHKFCRDDDDRALHDHPWWFVSFVWHGSYIEHLPDHQRIRHPGSLSYCPAEHQHRVALINGKPCWTIVVTGRKSRTWGFWCPKGFVPWYEFVAAGDEGSVGRGCE